MKDKHTAWLLLPLIGATVFGITLLFVPAIFSSDIFMYISASHMPTMYYGPPFSSLVGPFPPIPNYGVPAHFRPVLYGPLWLGIVSLLADASSNLVTSVLLFRGLALLVHLINCVLVWAILSKIAPAHRLSGTLLYAWNPLVLIELVVNGHNDGVAICLLLLAVWFYVQQRGRWFEVVALLCCGLAISVNLMALLIIPLLLWFMVRGERHTVRALVGFCWRGLVVLAVVCIVYAPVWQGGVTFLAIISSIDLQDFGYSFLALLVMSLSALYSQLTAGINLPSSVLQPVATADMTILASTIFIFALLYFQAMGRVHSLGAESGETPRTTTRVSTLTMTNDNRDSLSHGKGQEGTESSETPRATARVSSQLPTAPALTMTDEGSSCSHGRREEGAQSSETPRATARVSSQLPTAPALTMKYDVLFTSWTVVILGFVVLAATLFWPWYIVWVVWIVALRRFDALTIGVLLLSCTALLYYPLLHLDTTPAGIYVFLCVFGAPLVYFIAQRYLSLKQTSRSLSSGKDGVNVEQRPLQSS